MSLSKCFWYYDHHYQYYHHHHHHHGHHIFASIPISPVLNVAKYSHNV